MTPSRETQERRSVIGIQVTTSNAAEADPGRGKIAGLWGRFYAEDFMSRIPGKTAPAVPLGVYTDYESDHHGPYRLVAGAAVADGTPVPDGFASATIPAGRYLVFRAEGEMPRIVIETWGAIWGYFEKPSGDTRAFATDFEVYPAPGKVEIHISVR